jgi:hypothetical protein
MKKYFRMAVENIRTGERDTYVSEKQGSSPAGWKCTGVCGYFEADSVDLLWVNRRFFLR